MERLADGVQRAAARCAVGGGIVIVLAGLYLWHPVPQPPPLPAGVATIFGAAEAGGVGAPGDATAAASAGASIDPAAYLTFLQIFDARRTALLAGVDQTLGIAAAAGSAPASPVGAPAAPAGAPASPPSAYPDQAQRLIRDFLTQKPPPSCTDLANDYYRLLQDQTGMISKVGTFLGQNDTRSAAAARYAIAVTGAADAQAADTALGQISAAQHITPPFAITADPALAQNPASGATLPDPGAAPPLPSAGSAPPASGPVQPSAAPVSPTGAPATTAIPAGSGIPTSPAGAGASGSGATGPALPTGSATTAASTATAS